MQRVPSSIITYVSFSPHFIPHGRISRIRLVTIAFPCTTLLVQPKLKYLLTYTPNLVLVGTALSLVSATAFAEQ